MKFLSKIILIAFFMLCYSYHSMSADFLSISSDPWKFDPNLQRSSKETIPIGTQSPSAVSQALRDAFLLDDPFSIIQDEKQRNQVKKLISQRDFMIYLVCAYYSTVLEYDYDCVKENLPAIIRYYHGENLSTKQAFFKIKEILKKYPPCNQTLSSVLDDSDWKITAIWTSVKDGKKTYSFQWEDNISRHSILPPNSRSTTSDFMIKLVTDDPYCFVTKEKLNNYISYICSLYRMKFDLDPRNYIPSVNIILTGFTKEKYAAPSYSAEDWLKFINISFYLSEKYGRSMRKIILDWNYFVNKFMQAPCTDLELIVEEIIKDQKHQIQLEKDRELLKKDEDLQVRLRQSQIARQEIKKWFYIIFCIFASVVSLICIHIFLKKKCVCAVDKLFFCFTGAAILLLLIGSGKYPDGYYTFLRIITTISLAWFCFRDFPVFIRFIFLLGAILYNPVFPIHLGDRDIWQVFNVITVAALLAGSIAVIRKLKHKENVE